MSQKPGEYVIENLMKTFIRISFNKIDVFVKIEKEQTIRKGMRHNEDCEFQNLMLAMSACAENSLPSLLKALLDWHTSNHSQGNVWKLLVNRKYEKVKLPDVCGTTEMTTIDPMVTSGSFYSSESMPSNPLSDSMTTENFHSIQKRDLGVDYIFCQSVISVLKQLSLHPGHDEMLNEILSMAFKQFKYRDDLIGNPNNSMIYEIADLFAEVVGVLAQSRFNLVKIKFTNELKSLKSKEVTSLGSQSIISLLIGMKFFRVKMYPIEDFVECFTFLSELAIYFIEVDDKKIKHALAGLFVEVLLPVAAVVKNEVNIPVLKTFVDSLYIYCLDMCSKKKHFTALSPLVTCLLSIAQKQFFLVNWPVFMVTCLGQLKNRDPNVARVALESLFRLLWVYIVRIKGEKHSDTQSKLLSIVSSLFPKGSKFVVPRDASINIFVKIIHFIAQEKLDFAMKEIIFDLIGANRSHKAIFPERMNIGLCAFLLIALSLQQKEGEPPMPQKSNSESNHSSIVCSQSIEANQVTKSSPYHSSQMSGGRLSKLSNNKSNSSTTEWNSQSMQSKPLINKRKTSYSFMTLNDTNAASLGIKDYINPVRKSFDTMLRLLDQQVIRTMLLTKQENINKEFDDVMTGQSSGSIGTGTFYRKSKRNSIIDAERKPKIELLKTCISAIPRLLPAEMNKSELVELLSRLSIHIDEELRMMSQQALINIIQELPEWRFKTIQTYLQFVRKEISDSSPLQLENNMKILYHLINSWKSSLISPTKENNQKSKAMDKTILDEVEGFCLVMLCQYRSSIRRLSVHVLKEVKSLINQINLDLKLNISTLNISQETSVSPEVPKTSFAIDIIDNAAQKILEKCLPHLPNNEKCHLLLIQNIDFMALAERTNPIWGVVSNTYSNNANENQGIISSESQISTNLWSECIAIIFNRSFMMNSCQNALNSAWPLLMDRISHLFSIIDPSTQNAENRTSSLLRGSSSNKKPLTSNEKDHCMLLWKNYITAACCIAPLFISQSTGSIGKYLKSSPDQSGLGVDNSQTKTISSNNSASVSTSFTVMKPTSKDLLKILVPLIKCEITELRDSVIEALGHFNPAALRDMMDEIHYVLRESVEKKQENVRRRKRKDSLRLYIVKILALLAYNGIFDYSEDQISQLANIVDWLEQLKPYLIQSDISVNMTSDLSISILNETRLHFCRLLQYIILHAPKDKRQNLFSENFKQTIFLMIANWTGSFIKPLSKKKIVKNMELSNYKVENTDKLANELCYSAITTMCTLICCGQIFDSQALQEDGYILPWLLNIINSGDEKLMALSEETITLLLDYNSDTHTFLDVMIDCCYNGTNSTMKIVFLSIVRTFSNYPDYPCDYISVIILALVFTSNIDTQIKENAFRLLQLLYHRFFIDSSFLWPENNTLSESSSDPVASTPVINNDSGTKLSIIARWKLLSTLNQDEISKELSEMLPDLTLSVFSEITQRILTANPHLQLILLDCLVPWMHNIELIDFIQSSIPNTNSNDSIIQSRSPRGKQFSSSPPFNKSGLIGNGWGSKQATDLVLNNLFFSTVKFGQELNKSLGNIWACLVVNRPENILVIIHYLIVITSLAPNSLLSFAKQVIVFLAKEKPKKLIENLFTTLQTVDGINYSVERTQSLPFYRINNATNNVNSHIKSSCKPDSNTDPQILDSSLNLSSHDKGVMNGSQQLPVASVRSSTLDGFQISNKSQSEISDNDDGSVVNYPQSAPGTLRFDGLEDTSAIMDEDKYATLRAKDIRKKDVYNKQNINFIKSKDLSPNNIHPLPLPAYGGFCAPLNQFLTDEQCPIWTHSYKSSIVLMFFIDLVPIANTKSYWERDLELLLHCIILGLDHKEYLVFEQCKFLLIKILQILCPDIPEFKVINLLMTGSTATPVKSLLCLNGEACQSLVRTQMFDAGTNWDSICSVEPTKSSDHSNITLINDIDTKLQRTLSSYSVTSTVTLIPSAKVSNSQSKPNSCILENLETYNEPSKSISKQSKNNNIRELIQILCSCRDRPMWGYEDVTISRYINDGISAINQLSTNPTTSSNRMSSDINSKSSDCEEDELILISSVSVLNTIIKLICNLIDTDGTLVIKWAQLALNTGVNCTHRHYASRSLQIFRALGTTYDGTKLSALFSRLLDTIGDLNEDVQCYVVELFLTLECGIKNLNPQEMFVNSLLDNNSDAEEDDLYRSTPNLKNSFSSPKIDYHKDLSRQRGTTVGSGFRILNMSNHHQRSSAVIESTISPKQPSPRRPVSFRGKIKENKSTVSSNLSWDERTDLVCELFWLANILMESELEHEFYAGIRFLSLLMNCLNTSHFEMRTKLEKIVQMCDWSSIFPGTLHLLIKGCFSNTFWSVSAQLLSKMVLNIHCPLVDPTQKIGFPLTVMTLLVTIFDEETPSSRLAAKNIASVAKSVSPDRLGNLISVMQLYSGGTFNKDHTQWTRCVVKYLYDAFNELSAELLAFINRMLLECPPSMYNAVLQVLYNFIYYLNMNESAVISQLNKIIESLSQLFINTIQWKEVFPILRLMVSKNSSLSLPTSKVIESSVLLSLPMVPLPEAETPRLELPGRILEYQFDVKGYCMKNFDQMNSKNNDQGEDSNSTNKKSLSHTKTKELLLQLINYFGTYGYRIGFPKSPSVIFSQSTETLEHQVSLHSSSETTSTNDISLADDLRLDETSSVEQAQVIRDLDEYLDSQLKMNFLDLPDNKWEDDRKPSWGVRSQSITHYNDFPDSSNPNQSLNKTIQSSSTFADGTDSQINYLSSPSKTLPCRSHKSPISKAIGGPCSSITSPQMSRCESSVVKPQSLSIISSTPNPRNSFSFKTYSGNIKSKFSISPDDFRYDQNISKKNKILNSNKLKAKSNSISSEEDTNWKKKSWLAKSKNKEVSSSSSDEVDDEDDIDDDESLCRDEISSVMHKHGNQRCRLYTSSMERSSSNTYEKETESIWFETLTRALSSNPSEEVKHSSSGIMNISDMKIIPSTEWLSNLWIKFPLVFEDCCSKCRVCITEANYYLSTVTELSDIGSQFVEIITRVCKNLTTPLFHLGRNHFVDSDVFLESHKLTLMQLQETYDKFCNHMEYSIEILDLLKRSTRISHLEPIKPDEKRINLCRHLDKMMKQLFLMYESYCRLLCDLKQSITMANKPINEISNSVKNIANQLSTKIMSLNDKLSPTEDMETGYITNVLGMEHVEEELYKALLIEDITKVVNLWRLNRVGLVVFNKALESNNPSFYLMQMFCILHAKDNPDLLVYVSAQDVNNYTDCPQQVSTLAASLVPLSSKISELERDLLNDSAVIKMNLLSPGDNDQSVVNVTSDSSVM